MKALLRTMLMLALLLAIGCKATAQKFKTHAVKEGETLTSISKLYKVTPANILKYNKELKNGDQLSANSILVIPIDANAVSQPINTTAPKVDVKITTQEPIGFTSHKVRKRETLYGIAKRYNITEDDIKKYNRDLYSSQLKKRMVLRIPKFRKLAPGEVVINEDDYETYTVAPKETRWSIAHKYGITIDSMLVLNPDLSKTDNYLREGQELKLPKIAGSTIEGQETQLFISYTVPPKMNFYQLKQQFGVEPDDIVRLNPEITERGGLKEGMVIRIPQIKRDPGEVNTDNFIFYEVKPGQTEFSLTRKLAISYKDLLVLNPTLQQGLKAGMVLKLPKDQTGDFEVRNALVLDKINLLDSINRENRPKLMFLLPFRLNKLDLSDKDAVAETIENRTSLKLSLGLYSGALIALDSLAKLGVSIDVKTFDNQLDLNKTKEILSRENLSGYSAVIGPLDLASLNEVGVRAAKDQVPVITPLTSSSTMSLNNVFFSVPSEAVLRSRMLNYIKKKWVDQNIIIIADSMNVVVQDSILSKFPEAKIATVIEEEKNIGVNIEKLKLLLSREKENWVVLETDNFKLVSSVSSILNSFHNALLEPTDTEKIALRMFTTDKNSAFDDDVIPSSHLSNLNFTYPSVYKEVANNSFVRLYSQRFGDSPDRYAVRGFDLTFDIGLKLAYKNNLMAVSKLIGETEYSANKFSYEKITPSGYFNQASYIMSYDSMRIKEVTD